MRGGRLRVAIGLVLAIGGTLWLTGGPVLIGELVRTGLSVVPVALIIIGVGVILRLAVPRGSLIGPLLLLAAGLFGLGYQLGWITWSAWRIVPAVAVAVGIVLALSGRGEQRALTLPSRRYTSIVLPILTEEEGEAPVHAMVTCVLGRVELDLSATSFPDALRLTVDVTVLGGSVTLIVPHDWTLRPGSRLHLAHGTRFSGSVASSEPAPDLPDDNEVGRKSVVLNVRGLGGFVGIARNYSDGPFPAADEPAAPAGG